MRTRAKDVQTSGVVRLVRLHEVNQQKVGVKRVGGRVVVELVRSWLKKQRVKLATLVVLGVCGADVTIVRAVAAMERRQAEAVWVQDGVGVDGCRQVQVTVVITQNQTVPSPYYPDGWVRTAWVTLLEQDVCAQVQLVNAAGQLQTTVGLEVDRKLGSAIWVGTVLSWDGVGQDEGVISVSVDWVGVGSVSRVGRTISRGARAAIALSGFGLALQQSTVDAQISISK